MQAPIHKIKKLIVYGDNSRPPRWSRQTVSGYLATGVIDKNGNEISEGDIVHHYELGTELESVVTFHDGAFLLKHKLSGIESPLFEYVGEIEVVGHVAL